MAAEMVAGSDRVVHTAFACDVWDESRKWLTTLGAFWFLADMSLRIWGAKAGAIMTKDSQRKPVTTYRGKAGLDIDVCGFMCTPFTPNGTGWQGELAKTFWSSLKTQSPTTRTRRS